MGAREPHGRRLAALGVSRRPSATLPKDALTAPGGVVKNLERSRLSAHRGRT
jgi:hypothetical protein